MRSNSRLIRSRDGPRHAYPGAARLRARVRGHPVLPGVVRETLRSFARYSHGLFVFLLSNNMLYPKEDKENKQLLYAVSTAALFVDQCALTSCMPLHPVPELRLLPAGQQQLHLRQQDHTRGRVSLPPPHSPLATPITTPPSLPLSVR